MRRFVVTATYSCMCIVYVSIEKLVKKLVSFKKIVFQSLDILYIYMNKL